MKPIFILLLGCMIVFSACDQTIGDEKQKMAKDIKNQSIATFAGGCFWCSEADFQKTSGVTEVVSGYTGGDAVDPTYEQVSSGNTGHREAVQVYYDPDVVNYNELLEIFWKHIDPTDSGGQFVDRGFQYSSAIFYHDEEQKRMAEDSKRKLEESKIFDEPIATEIVRFEKFYPAEQYHQDYFKKNPIRYNYYRSGSGRDDFIKENWEGEDFELEEKEYKRPSEEEIKAMLSEEQYYVTQEDGTERAFENEYWDNEKEGIYVDIVTGEPLFSSKDKYESGTGWPSFTKPLEPSNIVEKEDRRLFVKRTEVRSRHGDSHLGHVFNDGPAPTGLRYCMNSAALRFVPKEKLGEEGYEEYLYLFD